MRLRVGKVFEKIEHGLLKDNEGKEHSSFTEFDCFTGEVTLILKNNTDAKFAYAIDIEGSLNLNHTRIYRRWITGPPFTYDFIVLYPGENIITLTGLGRLKIYDEIYKEVI